MPKDVIERAVKKGTGEIEGVTYNELLYEGFTPGKVAILVEIVTDNRNRTASELRKLFDKKGGTLGNPGSVAWMFDTQGILHVKKDAISEDDLMELVLEAGAEDVRTLGDLFEVQTAPDSFQAVRLALAAAEITTEFAEVGPQPNQLVEITEVKVAQKGAELHQRP